MVQDAYAAGRIDEGLEAYSTEYLAHGHARTELHACTQATGTNT